MRYFTGFSCVACKAAYARDQDVLLCPACDNLLEAEYEIGRRARSIATAWRRGRVTCGAGLSFCQFSTRARSSPSARAGRRYCGPIGSHASAVAVSNDEIRQAMRDLAAEGLSIEPSGSVSVAGLVASGRVARDECVVCLLSGSGFEDFERVLERIGIPDRVVSGFEELLAAATAAA